MPTIDQDQETKIRYYHTEKEKILNWIHRNLGRTAVSTPKFSLRQVEELNKRIVGHTDFEKSNLFALVILQKFLKEQMAYNQHRATF